ncbi:MAG: glycoside hydrolase family 4 [Planctomycetota bacterium]
MTTGPKVVIIGAGSYFFGGPVIRNMAVNPVLRDGTLTLVDTDPAVLETMERLAHAAFAHLGVETRIEAATDRRAVLAGADFVVPSFSRENTHYRGLDAAIADKWGIRMCSADTIGPGGIFRALREIPELLRIAADVCELCPHAWVMNYVNPSTVLGIALAKYAPQVRSFALCDGPHEPHMTLRTLKRVGILPEEATSIPPAVHARLDLRRTGVNHFSWIVHFTYEGRDMLPALRAATAQSAEQEAADTPVVADSMDVHQNADAKARFNASYTLQLMDLFGAYPDCMAHTKEYVPFFQGHGVSAPRPEPIMIFDAATRQQQMDEKWAETTAAAAGGEALERFIAAQRDDHATDIIASMWGDQGKVFAVNCPNAGAVRNMPDDAFLELHSHLDMGHVRPLHVGTIPVGVRGLCQQVLDAHELNADAAVSCDRTTLLRACAVDPIMNNLEDNAAIVDDLLDGCRDVLPADWYTG